MKQLGELWRSHRLALEVVGLLAVLALGAGLGVALWGPGGGTAAVSATSVPATHPPTPTTQPQRRGVRGRITAENAGTWTVTTVRGRAVTVTVTPNTKFGTPAAPATESQFTVGSPVAVVGTRSGDTLTAIRVFTPLHPLPGSSPSTGAATAGLPSTTVPAAGAGAVTSVAGSDRPDGPGAFSAALTRGPSAVKTGVPTLPTGQEGGEQVPPTPLLDRT